MWWFVRQSVRRAPQRLLLAAVAVAFPVAILSATLFFVDDSLNAMTRQALKTSQIQMRGLATTLTVDMSDIQRRLANVPEVSSVDLFGAADVIVGVPGSNQRVTARMFAVEPGYFEHHPWVGASGDPRGGILLNQAVAEAPGLAGATEVSVSLPGDSAPLDLRLPVTGQLDVRDATTWFAIPAGDVQGDIVVTPRAVLVDYATFVADVLPAFQQRGGPAPVTNPGLAELPPVSLEAHVAVDPAAYPSDPAEAAQWSMTLRRVLERQAPSDVIVADNTFEPLSEAALDATNAKVIFFLLGIPGALVAAALGLAAASALTEANRREDALLRLRGAADGHVARLAVGNGLLAGLVGTTLGLVIGAAGVSAVVGHVIWRDLSAGRLIFIALLATLAGALTTAARLWPIVRRGPRSDLTRERRHLAGNWNPVWLRARLDYAAVSLGLLILGGNILTGGLRPSLIDLHQQAQTITLSFYVLLAPVLLWVGASMLVVRGLLYALNRWSRPDRPKPLTSWRSTTLRWLGRRPARTATALLLGTLAVAFGTEVVVFAATYATAKQAEAEAAYGGDLRLVPATDRPTPLPDLGTDIQALTPIYFVPSRAGSDRKNITAIDVASYNEAVTSAPDIVMGGGIDALAHQPLGALVLEEVVADYGVTIGDILPITIYPDDLDLSQQLDLVVVGIFRSVPPTDPLSEIVMSSAAIPKPVPAPDLYLARVRDGLSVPDVANKVAAPAQAGGFTVTTVNDLVRKEQRSLTTLNLSGLSEIEAVGAAAVAAIGVGVLGAFLVLERRRELAILRSVGADTRQVSTGPLVEGSIAAIGSVVIGIPIGLGLAILAVRVLDLFFTLKPPLASLPAGPLLGLSALVLLGAAVALVIPLRRTAAAEVSSVLREV